MFRKCYFSDKFRKSEAIVRVSVVNYLLPANVIGDFLQNFFSVGTKFRGCHVRIRRYPWKNTKKIYRNDGEYPMHREKDKRTSEENWKFGKKYDKMNQ